LETLEDYALDAVLVNGNGSGAATAATAAAAALNTSMLLQEDVNVNIKQLIEKNN
jgi:hypothetical protein